MPNYPAPVNQFSRLVHVSGPEPTGTYALGSRWNNTRNGRNYDGANCSAAIGAVALDANTGGRRTASPNLIRNNQNDWDGGMGWDDVNLALSRIAPGNQLALQATSPRLSFDWQDVLHALRNRRFVCIGGDYDRVPFAYQAQKYGTFDHAFGLGGIRTDGQILMYDPLAKHARWVPQYAIRGAAEKLALAQRRTKSRLFVGLTRPMPPPYIAGVTYRYGGEPRARGRWLARRDNVPVRSRPDVKAPKVAELDHRQDFACRQSNGTWLGNAKGDKWVWREVMWPAGGITGQEKVQ